jgi:hypothetical protein
MKIQILALFLVVFFSGCDGHSNRKDNLLNNEINSHIDSRHKTYDTVEYYPNNSVKEINELVFGQYKGDTYIFDSLGNLIEQKNYLESE